MQIQFYYRILIIDILIQFASFLYIQNYYGIDLYYYISIAINYYYRYRVNFILIYNLRTRIFTLKLYHNHHI